MISPIIISLFNFIFSKIFVIYLIFSKNDTIFYSSTEKDLNKLFNDFNYLKIEGRKGRNILSKFKFYNEQNCLIISIF